MGKTCCWPLLVFCDLVCYPVLYSSDHTLIVLIGNIMKVKKKKRIISTYIFIPLYPEYKRQVGALM